MDQSYRTVHGAGSYEMTDRKSKFIAVCMPVVTQQQAQMVLDGQKRDHRTASHHVFAWRLREGNLTRHSDDGEPQSTAGLPVLGVLTSNGVTDAIIVVTRYFGGTLLGTGGLVRAYGGAAAGALEQAGITVMQMCSSFSIQLPYNDHDRIMRYLGEAGVRIEQTRYADVITLTVVVELHRADDLGRSITEITNGRCKAVLLSQQYAETEQSPAALT